MQFSHFLFYQKYQLKLFFNHFLIKILWYLLFVQKDAEF